MACTSKVELSAEHHLGVEFGSLAFPWRSIQPTECPRASLTLAIGLKALKELNHLVVDLNDLLGLSLLFKIMLAVYLIMDPDKEVTIKSVKDFV